MQICVLFRYSFCCCSNVVLPSYSDGWSAFLSLGVVLWERCRRKFISKESPPPPFFPLLPRCDVCAAWCGGSPPTMQLCGGTCCHCPLIVVTQPPLNSIQSATQSKQWSHDLLLHGRKISKWWGNACLTEQDAPWTWFTEIKTYCAQRQCVLDGKCSEVCTWVHPWKAPNASSLLQWGIFCKGWLQLGPATDEQKLPALEDQLNSSTSRTNDKNKNKSLLLLHNSTPKLHNATWNYEARKGAMAVIDARGSVLGDSHVAVAFNR